MKVFLCLSIYLFTYRLVSAYVNKCLKMKKNCGKLSKSKDISFPKFVNYVLKEYSESDCHKHYNHPCLAINIHWRPYNARCSYCDIPYNVIGRLETFEEDLRYLLLKQNLTHLIPLKQSSVQANHHSKSGS